MNTHVREKTTEESTVTQSLSLVLVFVFQRASLLTSETKKNPSQKQIDSFKFQSQSRYSLAWRFYIPSWVVVVVEDDVVVVVVA